jgi:WD40 repeat protein
VGSDKLAAMGHLKQRMLDDPKALHESVQLSLPSDSPQQRLVILVDQFEELFTICRDEKLRTAFVNNLVHASHVLQGRTLVLLAMRADFYGKCATYTDLANALSEHQQLIGPMTQAELREAIEQPAQKVGCEVEPGLTDLLVKDVLNHPGSLPFLQFALKELWSKRSGRRLTTEGYRQVGGVAGALQRKADEVYARLNSARQQICRRIFLRLTQPGEGTEDTKRRVPISELMPGTGSLEEIEAVLLDLSEAETRLITGEAEDGEEFFEVAHEALIRGWPALRKWIDADRQALLTLRRLTEAANEWSKKGRSAGFLYTGARLAAASEWAKTNAEEISPLESEFIKASRRHVRWQRLQGMTIVAILLLAGFTGVSWKWIEAAKQAKIAEAERWRADARSQEAETAKALADENARSATEEKVVAQHRLAEGYLDRGLRLCEEGEAGQGALWLARGLDVLPQSEPSGTGRPSNRKVGGRDAAPDPEHAIRANLGAWCHHISPLKTLLQHQDGVTAVAFSPDGKTVLTGSGHRLRPSGEARLWEAATGEPIGAPLQHQSSVEAVVFSPDGKTVLTGSGDLGKRGEARLWEAATGKPIGAPLQHQDWVRAAAFSPDGKTILTGSGDKTARLWEAATGKPIGAPLEHQDSVHAVAFSPDGKTILTGTGDFPDRKGEARLWEAATGKPISVPLQHHDRVNAVAFSPDGKTVLTGGEDGTARMWEAATGKPIGAPLQHRNCVRAVAFSHDGRTIITGSADNIARLWEAATGKPIGAPLRHQGSVEAVVFSPDGKTILTGSEDGTARLWDLPTDQAIGAPLQHQYGVDAVAFSPDGKTVLTGSGEFLKENCEARLWEAATGKPIGAPLQHQDSVHAVAFSPDGKMVLTGSGDPMARRGQARLWEAATGKPIGAPLQHQDSVDAVAFSPDGKTVLTGTGDYLGERGEARLWEVATGKPIGAPLQHQQPVYVVAFSPDGKTVLTGSRNLFTGSARLWEAVTGKPIGAPLEHQRQVYAAAFSPNGKMVLTGSSDEAARLWEAATGKPIGAPLQHQGLVEAVAFSPDGETILTGSSDKTARLWEAATGKPIGAPLQHQYGVDAVAFSPDGKTVLTGSADQTARLWDVPTGKPIGAPLQHQDSVDAVAFGPDGKTVLTGSSDKTARLWRVAGPIEGNASQVACWLQVITAMELDEGGAVRVLSGTEWLHRRIRLQALDGSPVPSAAPAAWRP